MSVRIACSKLSVRKQRGTSDEWGLEEKGTGQGGLSQPDGPDPARRFSRAAFRSSPLTESLEQASVRIISIATK